MTARCFIFLTALVTTAICGGQPVAEDANSTSSVYTIKNGHVVFPQWDNRTTEPESLLEIGVDDFQNGHVYRERLLVGGEETVFSKEFKIPEDATTLTIIARSRPAGDIFPRLRISLVTPDNNQHRLFEGYWQTVALETYKWELSRYVRGKKAKLRVEMLNPGIVEEQRTWYFLRANIY